MGMKKATTFEIVDIKIGEPDLGSLLLVIASKNCSGGNEVLKATNLEVNWKCIPLINDLSQFVHNVCRIKEDEAKNLQWISGLNLSVCSTWKYLHKQRNYFVFRMLIHTRSSSCTVDNNGDVCHRWGRIRAKRKR